MVENNDFNGRLPLRIRNNYMEPQYSALARLAKRHESSSPTEFLRSMNLAGTHAFTEIIKAKDRKTVPDLTGFSYGDFFDIEREPKSRTVSIKDCMIICARHQDPFLYRSRLCLECVREDYETYGGLPECRASRRVWWDLRAFLDCPIHKTQLFSSCPNCGSAFSDWSPSFLCCDANTIIQNNLAQTSVSETRLSHQIYLLNRIYQKKPKRPHVLDHTPIHESYVIMCHIGYFVMHTLKPNKYVGSFTWHRDKCVAPISGFEVLSNWPKELYDFIKRYIKPNYIFKNAPYKIYGSIFKWLSNTERHRFEVIEETIIDHFRKYYNALDAHPALKPSFPDAQIKRQSLTAANIEKRFWQNELAALKKP